MGLYPKVLLVDASGNPLLVEASPGVIQGPAAHDAAAAGNPVQAGGVYRVADPAVADGDVASLRVNAKGELLTVVTGSFEQLTVEPAVTLMRLTPANDVVMPASALSGRQQVRLSFNGKSGRAFIGSDAGVAIGTGEMLDVNSNKLVLSVETGGAVYGIGDSFDKMGGVNATMNPFYSGSPYTATIIEPWIPTQELYAASGFKIWKSVDYGKTWTQVYEFTSITDSIRAFRIVRRNSSGALEMLVGTSTASGGSSTDGGVIYRSTDSGATFTSVQARDTINNNYGIRCITVCTGSAAGLVLAGSGRYGVADTACIYRSTDYGATWTRVALPATSEAYANAMVERIVYFSGAAASAVCAFYVAHGLSVNNYSTHSIKRSLDGGATFISCSTPPTLNQYEPQIRGMFGVSSLIALASGKTGGSADQVTMWRTTDAGDTWTKIINLNENASSQFKSFVAMGSGMVLAGRQYGTDGGNLYYSTDSGATFTKYKDYSASINGLADMGNDHAIMTVNTIGLFLSKDSGLGVPVTVWEGK